ncbi:MAG: polya polymerase [Lachnospiraceae bacterium]
MKIYNISDTKKFFEVLFQCNGDVELVSAEGIHISLKEEGRKNDHLGLLAETYLRGTIREMELSFLDPRDAEMVCGYLTGMKAS